MHVQKDSLGNADADDGECTEGVSRILARAPGAEVNWFEIEKEEVATR